MTAVDANRAPPAPAWEGAGASLRPPGDALDVVLEHLRETVRADAALVTAVDRERTAIEPAATWFSSPELAAAVEPTLRRPYDRDRPGLTEAAVERGRPLLLPRLEDWQAAADAHEAPGMSPERWEAVRRSSAIACPIRTPLGRTLGALVVLALDETRPLRKADLDVVAVLADLAALARERSELLVAEAGRAREELMLKRVAEGTAGTLERQEVERRVIAHAAWIADAEHCRLTRVQAGSQRLTSVASEGEEADVPAATVGEVVRTRDPVLRAGESPSVHVPVELGPRLFGVLSLVRRDGREFGDADLALVQKVARIAAAALANAHDFEHERHLARTLAHGFVPASLPRLPGWEMGLLYEPADQQATGGDLYGAWPLASGEVAVVVGDVAGKGVETAALSAMARFFIEARSWDRDDPGAMLAEVSAMLHERLPADRFVTAFLGLLGRRRLRYASAGHLAPLVIGPDGAIEEAAGGGLPLGIERDPSYAVHELELGRDDVLFAFTDGIVEARRDGRLLGDAGLRRMVGEAAGMTREPQALAELVHDDVRAWARGLSDDAAILALRWRGLELAGG